MFDFLLCIETRYNEFVIIYLDYVLKFYCPCKRINLQFIGNASYEVEIENIAQKTIRVLSNFKNYGVFLIVFHRNSFE